MKTIALLQTTSESILRTVAAGEIRRHLGGLAGVFFEAIEVTAEKAVDTAEKILKLFDSDRDKINRMGRIRGSALQIHELLQRKAFVTIPSAARDTGLSQPTVTGALVALQKLGIASESTGRTWKRIYVYKPYLRLLNEGMDATEGQVNLRSRILLDKESA